MNPPQYHPGESPRPTDAGLPLRAGIGFKAQHFSALMADDAPPGFVEVHAENYMGQGGVPHAQLTAIRERLPVFVHGVGLSIGAEQAPDPAHMDRLAALIARYEPQVFSEHLAWSTHDGRFFNDLLPLCYDVSTLKRVCEHIDRIQARLGVRMLLENPSTYLEFEASTMGEAQFIASIVERTGCGLLLDVNNIHVSCHNNRHDAQVYLRDLPLSEVGEIHLGGHAEDKGGQHIGLPGGHLLIDNHGAIVAKPVWDLYRQVVDRIGPVPTLIEWDTDVPDYDCLRDEARQAEVQQVGALSAATIARAIAVAA